MKLRRTVITLVLCMAFIFMLSPVSGAAAEKTKTSAELPLGALQVRFLNMLNHNNNYGEDFYSIETLINNTVVGMLDMRESEDDDFIKADCVLSRVYDLYGIEICDISSLNERFPQQEGYIYIIPQGYSTYEHSFVSANENEDGTWSVVTDVKVTLHDGEEYVCTATTMFVPNEKSAFGFNILKSELLHETSTI